MDNSTRNVVHLSVAIFLLMFAYQCHSNRKAFDFLVQNYLGNIVLSVIERAHTNGATIHKNAGFYSFVTIYASFTIGNLLVPLLVEYFEAKWSLVIASLLYTLFVAGFLVLNEILLYASSTLLGLGAALLWNAQGVYLSMNSTETTSKKHSGIFFAIFDASILAYGFFLFFLLNSSKTTSLSKETTRIIYIVITSMSFCGFLSFLLLPKMKVDEKKNTESLRVIFSKPPVPMTSKIHSKTILCGTMELLVTVEMRRLAIPFLFTGFHTSLYNGLLTTCVANTLQLGDNTQLYLALSVICVGLGITIGGILFMSPISHYITRDHAIWMGSTFAFLGYLGIFLCLPDDSNQRQTNEIGFIKPNAWLVLLSGSCLSFGGTCWNIQMCSLMVDRFAKYSSRAWAVFKFYQAIAAMVFFFVAAHLTLRWLVGGLVVFLIAALLSFSTSDKASKSTETTSKIAVKDVEGVI